MILISSLVGNQCGKGKLEGFKYLFWPEIDKLSATNRGVIDLTVCVMDCPLYFETSLCYPN